MFICYCMWMKHAVVQLFSRVQFFVTPWTAARQASLSFTITLTLLILMSIESMMPSNHLIFCCSLPLLLIFPSIRDFSSDSALHIRWSKYWSFSFSISNSNEYSGLIFFRIDWNTSLNHKSSHFKFFFMKVNRRELISDECLHESDILPKDFYTMFYIILTTLSFDRWGG